MKILFLTDNFPPEVNAPASRTFEHCREWVRLGHDVTVITGVPNFPTGRVFPGYRNRLRQTEVLEGIRIVRVWTYIAANQGVVRRTLDYSSFMLSAAIAGLTTAKPDIVVGTSPQFLVAIAAYIVSRFRRKPFVLEVRDLWPESISAVGALRPGRALRILDRIAMHLYRRAARIVVVTQSFKELLLKRGIDDQRISVVMNGVDLQQFRPRLKDAALASKLGVDGRFVAGYVGTHGLAHGLETLLEAAALLATGPDADHFRFIFLGDGARKSALQCEAERRGLRNVLFLDSVPKSDVVRYWSILDVAVIHLRRVPLFELVIPSKLFECIGMGIPVVHGVEGESARIVEQFRVGRCFTPEDGRQLAEIIRELASDPQAMQAYRKACQQAAPRFDRRDLAARMVGVMQEAATRVR